MFNHFYEEQPREACGVILYNTGYRPCKNISDTDFQMAELDWLLAQLSGFVVAIVHTHVTQPSTPSEYDILQQKYFKKPYLIYSMKNNTWDLLI